MILIRVETDTFHYSHITSEIIFFSNIPQNFSAGDLLFGTYLFKTYSQEQIKL